jgi:hypothetical protein
MRPAERNARSDTIQAGIDKIAISITRKSPIGSENIDKNAKNICGDIALSVFVTKVLILPK